MENTHFGFNSVSINEKSTKVKKVFDTVANKYDCMNDFMSFGLHRIWKNFVVVRANPRPRQNILDIAGGTADLTKALASKLGASSKIWLTDINRSMLNIGRDRLINHGFIQPLCQCDAEQLPFQKNFFDLVTVAFGLRNMTNKEKALKEMFRVLQPGGKLLILEFSKIWAPLSKVYDFYSFKIIPKLGKIVADAESSYSYLAESIRMHPDQEGLKKMILKSGFNQVKIFNLSCGVVAIHEAIKF